MSEDHEDNEDLPLRDGLLLKPKNASDSHPLLGAGGIFYSLLFLPMDHRILEPVRTARCHEQPPAGSELIVRTIDWMLRMIRSQFQRFAENDQRETLLTEILPEHEEPMMILEQTLRKLHEALERNSGENVLALYQLAMTLSDVPESRGTEKPAHDPRTYYYRLLRSHPALENMRTCAIDEGCRSNVAESPPILHFQ